ncbi:MAG: hypothetical protein M1817_003204 [Caeruleum heppii]|nr:MAG: hypothetical protein M1817_003204 [Caeruleum heppii]
MARNAKSGCAASSDLQAFSTCLVASNRILALLGAGLSASSGLPTFRGAGGMWRQHDAMSLATPEAFENDPALRDNFDDPMVPALRAEVEVEQPLTLHESQEFASTNGPTDGMKTELTPGQPEKADPSTPQSKPSSRVAVTDLPHCPRCKADLLRPGVVWFGEALPEKTMSAIDEWIRESSRIDLMLVIGTSAKVWPAASYVEEARVKGARIAVVNIDAGDSSAGPNALGPQDFFFQEDAAVIVPQMFQAVIGEID